VDLVRLQIELDILKNQRALHRSITEKKPSLKLTFWQQKRIYWPAEVARCSRKLFTPRVHFHSRDTASHSPQARSSHNCTLSRVAQPFRLCHRKQPFTASRRFGPSKAEAARGPAPNWTRLLRRKSCSAL